MNLRQIDLNLAVALDALLRTRSVTRAAHELGLTQPAMSNALARLRTALADPLLVRRGRALVPTATAAAMQPALGAALAELDRALYPGRHFDPAAARALLRVALSDYWQLALLPRLLEWLEANAPGVHVDARPVSEQVLASDLPEGRIDAAIYLSPRSYPGVHAEPLVSDGYVCAVRRGHPAAKRPLTLAEYARHRQVMVTPRGPWAERMQEALQAAGLEPQFVLLTPHTQVALEIVSRTNYVAVLPRRIAAQQRRDRSLRLLRVPAELGRFSLALYFHERTAGHPLHEWFRAGLARLAREVYPGRP